MSGGLTLPIFPVTFVADLGLLVSGMCLLTAKSATPEDNRGLTARRIKDVALGIVFIAGYIYLLRLLHSFPTRAMHRIEWIEQVPPVVLNVAGWCLWIRHQRNQNPPWRQAVGWLGLIGNALAVCLPFLAFKYDLFVFFAIHGGAVLIEVDGVARERIIPNLAQTLRLPGAETSRSAWSLVRSNFVL